MTRSTLTLVQDLYAAFGARDESALEALLAPDVRWTQCPGFPGGADRRGARSVIEGVQYNRLMVTAMQAMGLEPSEYEREAGRGFGETRPVDKGDGFALDYDDSNVGQPLPAHGCPAPPGRCRAAGDTSIETGDDTGGGSAVGNGFALRPAGREQ